MMMMKYCDDNVITERESHFATPFVFLLFIDISDEIMAMVLGDTL